MLDSLRAFARTWIAKILLAVLVVSFGAFGINNVTGLASNAVARVGDEEISIRDFQREYEGQLQQAAQQFGRVPTNEEAAVLGIPNAAIARLAAGAAIDNLGDDLGLGASEVRLRKMLAQDPSFQDILGNLNREQFVARLRQAGYTEAEYLNLQTKAAGREQLQLSLLGDNSASQTALDLFNRFRFDKRTVDYFIVNDTALPPQAEPTDDELKTYLTANQEKFRTVETRVVDILSLSPTSLAATKTFTESEITAEYERIKSTLTKPERRTIRQIVLPDDAAVAAFEAGKTAGTKFEDVVAQLKLPLVELGTFSQAEVTDPSLATAAFALAAGDYAVIPAIKGKRVINVSAIEQSGVTSLEEKRADVIKSLGLAAARKEISDILDQVEELRAAFKPLSEIAERFKLTVTNVSVTAGGPELETNADIPADARARVATAIFAAKPEDKLTPAVALSGSQNIWFDLKSVEPARDQTLDEVRDALVAAWTQEKNDAAIVAKVEELTAALKSGTPIADLAVSINQFPQLSQAMTRDGDGTANFDASVAGAIFSGGADHFGSARNADGDYVMFKVVEVTPSSDAPDEQIRSLFSNMVRDSLYSQFVTALRDDAGLRVNQGTLNQILAVGTTGN